MTNQKTDEYGRVVFDEDALLEIFYSGKAQVSDLVAVDNPAIHAYNTWCKTFDSPEQAIEVVTPLDVSPEAYHKIRQSDWLMPQEYLDLNVEQWLCSKIKTDAERNRVDMELQLFRKHGMEDALRLFIYITEALKGAGVWWGVGRGSSVASYCLFLIGVHKVDSIKYDLNIKEFLKDS
jgi:DNA polymerase III alpha subunit